MRLVVMAKTPVPGRVKTRLIPMIGAEAAAGLCRAMTTDVVETARSTGLPFRLALEGEPDAWIRALDVPFEPQKSGDLGVRLRHALRDGGIAIGTDAPTLGADYLAAAWAGLEHAPVVFGPAFDGGYVLVGVRTPDIFDDIPWSSADTFAASHARAVALGLPPTVLPFWYDVDEPRDLVFLRNHLRTLPATVGPHTRAFLERLGA